MSWLNDSFNLIRWIGDPIWWVQWRKIFTFIIEIQIQCVDTVSPEPTGTSGRASASARFCRAFRLEIPVPIHSTALNFIFKYFRNINYKLNDQKNGVNNRFTSSNVAASAASVRKLNVGASVSNQRGLMEKFLASHGKISHIATPAFAPSA